MSTITIFLPAHCFQRNRNGAKTIAEELMEAIHYHPGFKGLYRFEIEPERSIDDENRKLDDRFNEATQRFQDKLKLGMSPEMRKKWLEGDWDTGEAPK